MTHIAERDLAQPRPSPPGSGAVVRLGICTGLLLGLGEGGLVLLHRILRPKLLFLGPDYYWMAPVAEAILFAGTALVLVGSGRVFPWLKSWTGAVTVYLFH